MPYVTTGRLARRAGDVTAIGYVGYCSWGGITGKKFLHGIICITGTGTYSIDTRANRLSHAGEKASDTFKDIGDCFQCDCASQHYQGDQDAGQDEPLGQRIGLVKPGAYRTPTHGEERQYTIHDMYLSVNDKMVIVVMATGYRVTISTSH